jgi:hypothetical protein
MEDCSEIGHPFLGAHELIYECPVYTTLHPVERYWRDARLTKILKELPSSSRSRIKE